MAISKGHLMKQTYAQLRDTLETGDIVLFSGKGGISAGIKYGQALAQRLLGHFASDAWRWSHVGMVVRVPEIDTVMLWESTTLSNVKCQDLDALTCGVQFVPLSERLASYDGEVAIRQLKDVVITAEQRTALMQLRQQFKGRPYEKHNLELIRSAWDGLGGSNQEDLSSLFCSELVAEAYQALKLFPQGKPSNEYTPADFASPGTILSRGSLGALVTLC